MLAAELEAALINTGTTPAVEELMIVAKPFTAQVPPKVEAEPET
jgi:hypothetical protein